MLASLGAAFGARRPGLAAASGSVGAEGAPARVIRTEALALSEVTAPASPRLAHERCRCGTPARSPLAVRACEGYAPCKKLKARP